jgi:hypothetical protein
VTVQTYVCLQPITNNGVQLNRGQPIALDDALPATQHLVTAKTIELQSSPTQGADVAATEARDAYIQSHGMTPEGGPFPGTENAQNSGPFGDVGPPDVGGGPGPGQDS